MKTTFPKLISVTMILALCLGLIGAAHPAQAAPMDDYIFTVNSSAPIEPDANPGDMLCRTASGKCTLYAAIQEANAMVSSNVTIEFDPAVTTITFTDTSCCLPPLMRAPGSTALTTIRGLEAVHLIGPHTYGSFVGLTLAGKNAVIQGLEISNFATGIYVTGNSNLIGSMGGFNEDVVSEGNLVEGNTDGIVVSGDENTISGNTIDSNQDSGIRLDASADGNMVGVRNDHFQPYYTKNIIDYSKWGISVSGDDNLIAGNSVSYTSITGISISGDGNTVGVDGDEFNDMYQANEVTHNGTGVMVYGDENIIAGNYAGVYDNGSAQPNNNGMVLRGSGNHVGPNGDGISDDLERNVISGNEDYGLILYGTNNTIQGNLIGLSPDGLQDRGNGSYGIDLSLGAADNVIGGVDEPWQANQIAYNSHGILVRSEAGVGNSFRGNSIYENDGMGIDLGPNYSAVNPNDANDADSGPNDLQNYPSVNGAALDGGVVTLVGTLQSVPDDFFALDFYATPECDPIGYGEGKTYLGSVGVGTDANGLAGFEVTFSGASATDYITALATNANGSTSEFSACMRPTLGGSLVVNSTADKVDDDPGDGLCFTGALIGGGEQECTLRAAVMEANAISGYDTILVPEGTYEITLSGSGENMARMGDLDLNDHLTISGAGAAVTIIDGGMLDRVFDASTNIEIEISDLTIQNGGGSLIEGGAILNEGNLRLLRSVVRQNDSWYGAVYNVVGGELHIEASTFYSNTADLSGGGLYVENGDVTIVNSTFSGNTADVSGGGIYVFSGNVAINNATLTLNGCDADAGDTYDGEGGGIYELNGFVTISNTIIAHNIDLQDAEQDGSDGWDCAGYFTSGGYNMIADQGQPYGGGTPWCNGFDAEGDLVSGFWLMTNYLTYYAAMGPLADNGGSTPTHMPLANVNPLLVDRANPAEPGSGGACAATDQRGVIRPLDGNGDGEALCDRGAVEYSMPTLWVHSPSIVEGQTGVFTVTLQPASEIAVTVQYTATSAVATLGTDFNAASGTLTFAPGETEKTVSVTTLQDALVEGSETFYLELGNEDNASLARDQGVGNILDDDVTPEIKVYDVTVDEGDSGSVNVGFRITLSEASGNEVTISYATRDGNTEADDYVAAAGQVSFAPGETTIRVYVQVVGDTVLEGQEFFYLDLSNAAHGVIVDGTAQCTIHQSDGTLLMVYAPLALKK